MQGGWADAGGGLEISYPVEVATRRHFPLPRCTCPVYLPLCTANVYLPEKSSNNPSSKVPLPPSSQQRTFAGVPVLCRAV